MCSAHYLTGILNYAYYFVAQLCKCCSH